MRRSLLLGEEAKDATFLILTTVISLNFAQDQILLAIGKELQSEDAMLTLSLVRAKWSDTSQIQYVSMKTTNLKILIQN